MTSKTSKIFPKLSSSQIDYLRRQGKELEFKMGDVLIEDGKKNYDFFVIVEGKVDILDPYNRDKLITTHESGEFTGDSDMLSERASIFTAVAQTNGSAIKISQMDFKQIISKNSDLNDLFIRAFILRRADLLEKHPGGMTLVGSRFSPESFKIREFLSKNHLRFTWLDLENDKTSQDILKRLNVSPEETPILIDPNSNVYRNPSIEQIAEYVGVAAEHQSEKYDVLIVGAGPAGLAASVYGASEGLCTITIDRIGPGGQAGASSLIENYLGFPAGISGGELANRAYLQAQKFGCTISIPLEAKKLEYHGSYYELKLESGKSLYASAVIAATGVRYQNLPIDNYNFYKGRGIYNGATAMEARNCKNEEAAIIGGGNSAGQAAAYLAKYTSHVHLVIRGENLEKSMSSYLINRIIDNPKITLHTGMELIRLEGKKCLEKIHFIKKKTDEIVVMPIAHLFLFIGAQPCTYWMDHLVCKDEKGFVLTGDDLTKDSLKNWPLDRMPYPLETCMPGLFAVGDMRSGSTKRVASAVGEGSMAISYVHKLFS